MNTCQRPLFSVCIPAYNDAASFSRCLDSVLNQEGTRLECLVSDDSSTDAIWKQVEAQKDSRVRYVRHTPGLGAPANWNAALALASGEIATLLHQDDWYRSRNVLAEVETAMEESGVDVLVTGRALYAGGRCLGEYADPSVALSCFLRDFPARSLVVNRLGHPSVFFFRKALLRIRYTEDLLYFSDTEYYQRLLSAADRSAVLARPLVALERGAAGQLSAACLEHPETLAKELLQALDRRQSGPVACGLACARLLASHLRLFPSGALRRMAQPMRYGLSASSLLVLCAALPFFCFHMLYRLAYRHVRGKPWS